VLFVSHSKSIFTGATKAEILHYLQDARLRIGGGTTSTSSSSSSQQAAHQIGSAQLLGLQMDIHRLRICIRCKAVTAEIRLMPLMCWYP